MGGARCRPTFGARGTISHFMRFERTLALWLAMALFACSGRAPHVLVTVDDPEKLACKATELVVGRDLLAATRVSLPTSECATSTDAASRFPLTVVVARDAPSDGVELWIEARDAQDRTLARGMTVVSFDEGPTGGAQVALGAPCDVEKDCNRGRSRCDGWRACDKRVCARDAERPCRDPLHDCMEVRCVGTSSTALCSETPRH